MGTEIVDDKTLPWMVTIQMKHNYSKLNIHTQVFCTGTIINEKYILTAAHCFQGWTKNEILSNPSASLVIGFGSTNFKNQTLIEFNNKMIKIHPRNKNTNNGIFGNLLYADLALIELPESSKLNLFSSSQNARSIKLTNRLPLIKTKTLIAGWGWIKPFCEVNASIEGKTDQLQSGWVELMENNLYCVNEMEVSLLQQFNKTFGQNLNIPLCLTSWIKKITENNWSDKLCVRPSPSSIQYGDSGGPLLVDFGDSWYQIGVVTQGMCNKDKKFISNQDYATFTQIDCEWIQIETKGKVLCR